MLAPRWCAQAVEWARRAGIAIYARSTFDPVAGDGAAPRQTVVRCVSAPSDAPHSRAPSWPRATWSWASIDDAARLPVLLHAAEGGARVAQGRVGGAPRGGAAPPAHSSTCPDWGRALRGSSPAVCPGSDLTEGVAVASVVGDGLAASAEPLVRFLGALREAGIAHHQVTATPLRLGAQ